MDRPRDERTRTIRRTGIDEVLEFLDHLGPGNRDDNINRLGEYDRYALVELSNDDFLGLIFLQNDEVLAICPRGADRRLEAVARRAIDLHGQKLSDNWNLETIKTRTTEELARGPLRSLVLRPTLPNERQHGAWYIQDGSHTALGYAMKLISGEVAYSHVQAFVASIAP